MNDLCFALATASFDTNVENGDCDDRLAAIVMTLEMFFIVFDVVWLVNTHQKKSF